MIDTEALERFVNKYNRLEGTTSTENFLLFYSTILKALTSRAKLVQDAVSILGTLVERIRILDGMIDHHGLDPAVAFALVFPEMQNSSVYSQGDIAAATERHCTDHARSESLRKRAEQVIERRFGNRDAYSLLLARHLAKVYAYARHEAAAKLLGARGIENIETLVVEYNCDFFLYNAIIFDLFLQGDPPVQQERLRSFLRHYFVIDGILDSLCDLFDDEASGAFNFLLCVLNGNHFGDLRQALLERGVYQFFFQIAEGHHKVAKKLLGQLSPTALQLQLSCYLEGAWEGLCMAKDNDFFADSDPSSITEVEKLLYKPHPWEVVDGTEVLTRHNRFLNGLQRRIRAAVRVITEDRVSVTESAEKAIVSAYYQEVLHKALDKEIIILRTSGCSKAFMRGNKCHHCGIVRSYYTNASSQKDTLDSLEKAFHGLSPDGVKQLGIYCLGSFFDDEEIREDTRQRIYKSICQYGRWKSIVFESRPEFITDDRIRRLREAFPTATISVGIGFDARSDVVRNVILNKGILRCQVESAIGILKKYGVQSLGYVSVKPPLLTEAQGIREAIRTGSYLQGLGVDVVSIEPIAVQRNTLQAVLARFGRYRVPWLWSCVEVARALCTDGRVLFGGFAFLPVPLETAKNCEKCTEEFIANMKDFNIQQDISIFNSICCSCKRVWQRTLNDRPVYIAEGWNDSVNSNRWKIPNIRQSLIIGAGTNV